MKRIVIGIVGPIASGKGIVAKEFKKKGFCVYSLSDRIREEIRKKGEQETRVNLTETANNLRKKYGPDILAKRTFKLVQSDGCERVVIEAIRNPKELEFIKNNLNAIIIGVDAPQKRRYEFMQLRNRAGDPQSFEEFVNIDNQELSNTDEHKMNISYNLKMADHIIHNNGTLKELKKKVNILYKTIKAS